MPHSDIFDAVVTPLCSGINFIEASAGTGKTYTIAMLVLRAVTQEAIDIDRILIVTFTRAAAAELQGRVRARLVEARDLLMGRVGDYDEVLLRWSTIFAGDEDLARKYSARLQLAIVDIDRAGIFTIHSFCQRMLQEQALESGQLFDVELLTSLDDYRRQGAEDFWRINLYTLPLWQCSLLLSKYTSPASLLAEASFAKIRNNRIEPTVAPLETLWGRIEDCRARIGAWWQKHGRELQSQLSQGGEEGTFKETFADQYIHWLGECQHFFVEMGDVFPENIAWLSRDGIAGEVDGRRLRGNKKAVFVEALLLPDADATELLEKVKELFISFRVLGTTYVEQSVGCLLEKNGATSFDELISRLSASLKNDMTGRLKSTLQSRYDLALIDEFQDTDTDQWYIFSTLFGTEHHFLYLIGDPKQAIYKFRGADIHSYFQARTEAQHFYSLDKNYRSHPSLVEAVNTLFLRQVDPFLFADKGLLYQEIKAAKDGSTFLGDGDGVVLPSFIYGQLEPYLDDKSGKWTSGKADTVILNTILQEVSELLSPSSFVQCYAGLEDVRVGCPIQAQDIAILVRSNGQAERYQEALVRLGVPAIIAGRKTIFQTMECRELLLVLQAIIDCDNLRSLKSAMTTSLFGCTGDQLVEIWQDEEAVQYWYNFFGESNRTWHESGALIMLYHFVGKENLFAHLAALTYAERRIANFTHLFEVLQNIESDRNFGPRQTLLWLQTAYEDGSRTDEVELRLESDEEAVQIVTIHSSKGLQYPIVFCPDIYRRSARLKYEKSSISCNDNGMVTDFGSIKFEKRRDIARREELAEELRLLYVAVTRAQLRCYVFWCDVKGSGALVDKSFASAFAHLLFGQLETDYSGQSEVFQALAESTSVELRTVRGVTTEIEPYLSQRPQQYLQHRTASGRLLTSDWRMTSYSALASLSDHAEIILDGKAVSENVPEGSLVKTPFAVLPKGARFGNIVHDLLEENAFSGLVSVGETSELLDHIEKKSVQYGVELDHQLLTQLLQNTVTAPLSGGEDSAFTLAGLDEKRCLKEMEFYIHLAHINMDAINLLLANEATVQPLSSKNIQGYLTGFIDLICVHDNKYYVIDYKSNYLGDSWSDYSGDKLVEAMASHNYGLQYFIYSVVLHQHLQTFVKDYRYQEHFGGVRYLFLRGMTSEIPGNGVFASRPEESLVTDLDQLVRNGGYYVG